jgi:Spy/CpxP family protein refolding chaperone
MRRIRIAGAALALTLVVAGSVTAQGRGEQRQRAQLERQGRGGPGGFRELLRGIELTSQQQTRVQAVLEQNRPPRPQQDEARAGQRAEGARAGQRVRRGGPPVDAETRARIEAARERGDTATVREIMQAQRKQMEANRERTIQQVRQILTSEQRAQFDRNVQEMNQRSQNGRGRGPNGTQQKPNAGSRIGV